MAKDTRNFKATPVEDYRRKIGQHSKKVVQKDLKQQKKKTDNHRNFGKALQESWKIILSISGFVLLASTVVYSLLLRAPVLVTGS